MEPTFTPTFEPAVAPALDLAPALGAPALGAPDLDATRRVEVTAAVLAPAVLDELTFARCDADAADCLEARTRFGVEAVVARDVFVAGMEECRERGGLGWEVRAARSQCCSAGAVLSNQPDPYCMYIVAIAWLYVVMLMALTEPTFTAGIATFVFYGVLPLALLLWILGTPERRRRRSRLDPDQ